MIRRQGRWEGGAVKEMVNAMDGHATVWALVVKNEADTLLVGL